MGGNKNAVTGQNDQEPGKPMDNLINLVQKRQWNGQIETQQLVECLMCTETCQGTKPSSTAQERESRNGKTE